MSGPGREFDKMFGPGRAARLARGRGSRVADFARGRGARGAGRRPPATLPTLLGTEAANSYPSHHSQAAKCRTLLAHWQPLPGAMARMRRPVRLLRARVATRRLDPGPGESEAHATRSQHSIPSLAPQARRPGGAYSTSPASPTPVPRQPTLPHPAPPFEPSPSTRRPARRPADRAACAQVPAPDHWTSGPDQARTRTAAGWCVQWHTDSGGVGPNPDSIYAVAFNGETWCPRNFAAPRASARSASF